MNPRDGAHDNQALSAPGVAAPGMGVRVVVMGVSGCGKSTLAASLAQRLNVAFVEGDQLHPPSNVQRMAAGIPLTDADRQGWLQTIGQRLAHARAQGVGLVVSCSALRRSYRDLLRSMAGEICWVHPHGPRALLFERLSARPGHYMPPSLLDSQLATLELPTPDEGALQLDLSTSPEQQVMDALRWLHQPAPRSLQPSV